MADSRKECDAVQGWCTDRPVSQLLKARSLSWNVWLKQRVISPQLRPKPNTHGAARTFVAGYVVAREQTPRNPSGLV